jgi:hypothetical protein
MPNERSLSPCVNKGYTRGLTKTYDFIVVGRGIAGGSIAYELARTARSDSRGRL